MLFYYFDNHISLLPNHGYAPTVVVNAIGPICALAYAVTATMAVWEMGRLKEGRVWDSPIVRTRLRVAINAGVPILLVSGLMLALPAALAFVQTGVRPTVSSLVLLGQQLLICVAYIAIGYGVGFWTPRLISAPILGGLVYYFVAFSVAGYSYAWRHLVGYFFEPLMFGELPTRNALLAPLVLIGAVAVASTLIWISPRHLMLRCCVAAGIAVAGVPAAYSMVQSWGASTPVVTGAAPVVCTGKSPEVCMPEISAAKLDFVHTQAVSVARELKVAGISETPRLITDRLSDGRHQRSSTDAVWRAQLTAGVTRGDVRYQIALSSLHFPCAGPDQVIVHTASLWVATTAGEGPAYEKLLDRWAARADSNAAAVAEIKKQAREARAESRDKQQAWYEKLLADACEEAP
ncbi:DUF7224 domain-containing protein [Streptomyces sp. DSM 40750]|uniref:DUF7224 domain-containing protein n=1 Tax=Streptomyces sp. DSM 40750 TaxID=2801030 RepID=UPI00214D0BDE|nr:hypothetical protein [Streptomyces sp. DSM 40750]UUU24692.1 hypothetical protein JIX55_33035 [Streptomyces sp. DSM 40750]